MPGGSTTNNPKALSKAAGELLKSQMTAQQEVTALLSRIQLDARFAQAFDRAAFDDDETMLLRLLKEGGLESDDVTIEVIDKDVKIHLKGCFLGFCFEFDLQW
jgi:hypothetical protein